MTMKQKTGKQDTFPSPQSREAMMLLEELFERCLCPFLLLGETAKQIYKNPDGEIHLSKIECGVKKNHWTPSTRSIFDLVISEVCQVDNTLLFTINGIPVEMKIIQNDYPFLEFPDMHHYYVGEFMLPNPFDSYLKNGEVE